MIDQKLIEQYNYPIFAREYFELWMQFDESPVLGQPAPVFPLWKLENRQETSLKAIWSAHHLTVVEFGSFT